MDDLIITIICLLVLLLGILYVVWKYYGNNNNVEEFLDNANTLVTDNVVLHNDLFSMKNNPKFNYNYASLNNGSIQAINELTQQVTEQVNTKSKIIFFNEANQPIVNEKLDLPEFDEYAKFVVNALNSNLDYKCFTLISVEPLKKIKCPKQIKYEMFVNTAYKHPDDKELIHIQLVLVLLHEQGYTECPNFCEKLGDDDLTPDYVKGTTYTYIDTFMLNI